MKSLGSKFGITPCFMAKPRQGLPGNSGHMHVSIVDKSGKNLFYRGSKDESPDYPDLAYLSDTGRHFLAGLLDGLPDVMPIVAPTVNSYKRLVENFWAPVTVSWGLEHRAASIRLIAPPTASAKATRFEVRVCGADANPFLVLAAILALGWRGIEKKMAIKVPPLGKGQDVGGEADQGERLAKSLKEATARFVAKESVAREVFGDEFVEHFGGTREHEVRLWDEAVTDWSVLSCVSHVVEWLTGLWAGRSRGISKRFERLAFASVGSGYWAVNTFRGRVEGGRWAQAMLMAISHRFGSCRVSMESFSRRSPFRRFFPMTPQYPYTIVDWII